MPVENYQVVTGVVIAIIFFLLAGAFIMILVNYYNNRKRRFMQEKESLETKFTQQLLQVQLEMQEQTFNAISSEIHDNVGQVLSLAKVQLNIIDQGEVLNRPLLQEAKESVGKALTDLRDIAKSLDSTRIQSVGLPEITNIELQRIDRSGLMSTSMKVSGEIRDLAERKKLIIFRIVQESLQNIIKHSGAKNLEVNFMFEPECLHINIKDDGKGFDKELMIKKEGLGLQNIGRRAAMVGGEAIIDSFPNKGTIIQITLPYG